VQDPVTEESAGQERPRHAGTALKELRLESARAVKQGTAVPPPDVVVLVVAATLREEMEEMKIFVEKVTKILNKLRVDDHSHRAKSQEFYLMFTMVDRIPTFQDGDRKPKPQDVFARLRFKGEKRSDVDAFCNLLPKISRILARESKRKKADEDTKVGKRAIADSDGSADKDAVGGTGEVAPITEYRTLWNIRLLATEFASVSNKPPFFIWSPDSVEVARAKGSTKINWPSSALIDDFPTRIIRALAVRFLEHVRSVGAWSY